MGASVSILAADAEAGVGKDMLGAEVEAEGSVGNAKAEVKGEFSITDDGVNANVDGEVMVSAVEGEAKGTINILGIVEGGVAVLLGVSGGVEIGFQR